MIVCLLLHIVYFLLETLQTAFYDGNEVAASSVEAREIEIQQLEQDIHEVNDIMKDMSAVFVVYFAN